MAQDGIAVVAGEKERRLISRGVAETGTHQPNAARARLKGWENESRT